MSNRSWTWANHDLFLRDGPESLLCADLADPRADLRKQGDSTSAYMPKCQCME